MMYNPYLIFYWNIDDTNTRTAESLNAHNTKVIGQDYIPDQSYQTMEYLVKFLNSKNSLNINLSTTAATSVSIWVRLGPNEKFTFDDDFESVAGGSTVSTKPDATIQNTSASESFIKYTFSYTGITKIKMSGVIGDVLVPKTPTPTPTLTPTPTPTPSLTPTPTPTPTSTPTSENFNKVCMFIPMSCVNTMLLLVVIALLITIVFNLLKK